MVSDERHEIVCYAKLRLILKVGRHAWSLRGDAVADKVSKKYSRRESNMKCVSRWLLILSSTHAATSFMFRRRITRIEIPKIPKLMEADVKRWEEHCCYRCIERCGTRYFFFFHKTKIFFLAATLQIHFPNSPFFSNWSSTSVREVKGTVAKRLSKVTPLRFGRLLLLEMDLRLPSGQSARSYAFLNPPVSVSTDTVSRSLERKKRCHCHRTCCQKHEQHWQFYIRNLPLVPPKWKRKSGLSLAESCLERPRLSLVSRITPPLIAVIFTRARARVCILKRDRERRRSFVTTFRPDVRRAVHTYGDMQEAWLRYVTRAPGSVTKQCTHAHALFPSPPRCTSSSNIFPSVPPRS